MATISTSTLLSIPTDINVYEKVTSAAALLGDTVELAGAISEGLTHVFIGIQMFDVSGVQILADSAGTFTVSVKTANSKVYEAPPTSVIDATAPETLSVAGNISDIRVVPALLSTTVTYRVIVTANGS